MTTAIAYVDRVHGFHNDPRRFVWRFGAAVRSVRLNEHLTHHGNVVFRHACKLGCVASLSKRKEEPMLKIALAVAAAAAALTLTTAPLATPSKAQDLKTAQVDVQIGRDRYDRYDRRRYDNDATVGIGPGGVTIGPRQPQG
jgi:hypothetical protein